jgi:hypothetical protein
LKEKIGASFYDRIDSEIKDVDGKQVFVVTCRKPSAIPCFVDGVDFYVRTTPATDKLQGLNMWLYAIDRAPPYMHPAKEEQNDA